MADQSTSFLDSIRNEEYTGENRCIPCTFVNVAIAVVVSAVVAVRRRDLAVLVFGLSALAIYLRGYLVPGTPTLTKRYLPDHVLERFDKHPEPRTDELSLGGADTGREVTEDGDDEPSIERSDEPSGEDEDDGNDTDEHSFETLEKLDRRRTNRVDPEQFLRDAGVVGPCEDSDDLCFTEEFESQLAERLETVRDGEIDREAVGAIFDADGDDVTFKDREYPAVKIGRRIRKWPSDSALVADVATHRTLMETADGWTDVPVEQRVDVLETLRSFHATCPLCGGPIVTGGEVVESCCSEYEVISIGCEDCDERILELDPEAIGDGASGLRP